MIEIMSKESSQTGTIDKSKLPKPKADGDKGYFNLTDNATGMPGNSPEEIRARMAKTPEKGDKEETPVKK